MTLDVQFKSIRHRRSGAALLLCLFAAAIIGTASVAIFQSHRSGAVRIEAIESQRVAYWAAVGAAHRALGQLRVDKSLRGVLPFVGPEAVLQVQSVVTVIDKSGKLSIQAVSRYRSTAVTYVLEMDPAKL